MGLKEWNLGAFLIIADSLISRRCDKHPASGPLLTSSSSGGMLSHES